MTNAGAKTGAKTTRGKRKAAAAKARTTRRGDSGGSGGSTSRGFSLGREIFSVAMGCVGILFGLGVIGLCIAGWYGCNLAVSVLKEIGERDFSGPKERIKTYEMFLSNLGEGDYTVRQGKPSITLGKEMYTWVVQPRGSNEMRRFQWVHDYELNEVFPRTNPALCLDIELGFLTEDHAGSVELAANEGYDPQDMITLAMVQNNFSLIQAQHIAGGAGWDLTGHPESTVGAPRLSPAEASKREGEFYATVINKPAEEEEEVEDGTIDLGDSTDAVGIQGAAGVADNPTGV